MDNRPIEILNLDKRVLNVLKLEEINTIEQLLHKTNYDLLKLPNMGKTSLNRLIDSLKKIGHDLIIEHRPKITNRPKIRLQIPIQKWQIEQQYMNFKYKIDYETFKEIVNCVEKIHYIK